ncbi:helix-turn-helix domain-containing protein [Bacillus sp. UNC438CL73TsuS30]|uniref:helix-turn-helix domain-containing protein n=1 Tax=Bacillus sp. UNC438CL73TsuS30 TaxID=1340434 RepID=UPI00068967BF|nr:helix-turn-helix domain-containing protein [Bacillus sp. UNC438CL73TsuS30]
MQKVYDKTKQEGHFFRLPTDIRHYVFMDGYKTEMNYLYALIVDYYNAKKGYAFPSQYTLAAYYGKAEKTVVQHLKVLKRVGLIEVVSNGRGRVNHYKPLKPLSKEELFAKYPEAAERYEKVIQDKERLAASDLGRLPKNDPNDWEDLYSSMEW